MKLTNEQKEKALRDGIEALQNNPKKNVALIYPDGFVPNSYHWPAPAERVRVTRTENEFLSSIERYDRKRRLGHGSYITLWISHA